MIACGAGWQPAADWQSALERRRVVCVGIPEPYVAHASFVFWMRPRRTDSDENRAQLWGRLPTCGPMVYRSIRAQPGRLGPEAVNLAVFESVDVSFQAHGNKNRTSTRHAWTRAPREKDNIQYE
jgi:hypothetical protein